jgi:hypothetical protein
MTMGTCVSQRKLLTSWKSEAEKERGSETERINFSNKASPSSFHHVPIMPSNYDPKWINPLIRLELSWSISKGPHFRTLHWGPRLEHMSL